MTTINSNSNKDHFKLIEVPLSKFHTEALPYHLQLYKKYKEAIDRCMSNKNSERLSYELKTSSHNVRQLKELLYELDTLRTRVYDVDLDRFDTRTFSLRKDISSLIKDYAALEKSALVYSESQNEINENIENENPFREADQIQIHDDLDKLQLEQAECTYQNVNALNKDIQSLHGIYVDLNTIVHTQKESVNMIETNVVNTQENVNQGLSHLIDAHKLKAATYPISGAVLGGLVGGPIGLVAGFKVGGLAALGCGIAGYTGGKLFKNFNEKPCETISDENQSDIPSTDQSGAKKDI